MSSRCSGAIPGPWSVTLKRVNETKMATLPLFALLLKIVYAGRGRRYPRGAAAAGGHAAAR